MQLNQTLTIPVTLEFQVLHIKGFNLFSIKLSLNRALLKITEWTFFKNCIISNYKQHKILQGLWSNHVNNSGHEIIIALISGGHWGWTLSVDKWIIPLGQLKPSTVFKKKKIKFAQLLCRHAAAKWLTQYFWFVNLIFLYQLCSYFSVNKDTEA